MSILVTNIRMPLDADEGQAFAAALRQLRLGRGAVKRCYLAKTSYDLRHRSRPQVVCSVGIELAGEGEEEAAVLAASSPSVTLRRALGYHPQPGSLRMQGRPVVAGFGPAGMFAGLWLARAGYRPLIVERGADVDTRASDVARFWAGGALNPESNVQFGEGGAGTFSDGKLVTRINDPLCEAVLEEFVRHGAPESVARLARPHIGTDRLREVVKSIRCEILRCGGEILFHTQLTEIGLEDGKLRSVCLGEKGSLPAEALILAVGHSARDTFAMLQRSGIRLDPKPFSVGVRIEHLQQEIDRGLYGDLCGHPRLPKGEYQLSLRQGGRAVYTFCMCPGGTVVAAASEAGGVVTNGMSEFARDGINANAALAVSVDAFPTPAGGIDFQRRLETAAFEAGGKTYKAPFQTVQAFQEGSGLFRLGQVQPSYPVGVEPARLDSIFPDEITAMLKTGLAAFHRRLPGFAAGDALLTGVETRTSSPVRIPRSDLYESVSAGGVYPAGEGAGYAGGIMSAAVDGLRAAGAIIEKFAPLM